MLKRKNKNIYRVLKESAGCIQLECVTFIETEDLGDGIMANRLGQQIWVAGYFVRHFETVSE